MIDTPDRSQCFISVVRFYTVRASWCDDREEISGGAKQDNLQCQGKMSLQQQSISIGR
jgi:hypothetical protein